MWSGYSEPDYHLLSIRSHSSLSALPQISTRLTPLRALRKCSSWDKFLLMTAYKGLPFFPHSEPSVTAWQINSQLLCLFLSPLIHKLNQSKDIVLLYPEHLKQCWAYSHSFEKWRWTFFESPLVFVTHRICGQEEGWRSRKRIHMWFS